jgi:hypothetical protein
MPWSLITNVLFVKVSGGITRIPAWFCGFFAGKKSRAAKLLAPTNGLQLFVDPEGLQLFVDPAVDFVLQDIQRH